MPTYSTSAERSLCSHRASSQVHVLEPSVRLRVPSPRPSPQLWELGHASSRVCVRVVRVIRVLRSAACSLLLPDVQGTSKARNLAGQCRGGRPAGVHMHAQDAHLMWQGALPRSPSHLPLRARTQGGVPLLSLCMASCLPSTSPCAARRPNASAYAEHQSLRSLVPVDAASRWPNASAVAGWAVVWAEARRARCSGGKPTASTCAVLGERLASHSSS